MKLKRTNTRKLVDDVSLNMPCGDCRTCDCFLGFVTQLELDSQEDLSDILNPLKVSKEQIHSCLGCDPCPPAEAYSNYLRQNLEIKAED